MQTTSGLTERLLSGNGRGWLPIDTDYLFYLQDYNSQRIVALTQIGVKANLEMARTVKRIEARIETGLNSIAHQIHAQTNTLANTNRILKDILPTLENPRAIEAAEKARIAAQNMKEAQSMTETRAKRLLDEAFDLLQESLEIHPFDYKANFDLAWLWQYYREDLGEAETCYDNAVLRSLKKDPDFAVFGLRHLANIQRERGNVDGAIESLKEAYELQKGERDLTQFEYAHALILSHQSKQAALLIQDLVKRNADYYSLTAAHPVLMGDQDIAPLINDLYSYGLQEAKHDIMKLKSVRLCCESTEYRMFYKSPFGRTYSDCKEDGRIKFKDVDLGDSDLYKINRRVENCLEENLKDKSYAQLGTFRTEREDFWKEKIADVRRAYVKRLAYQEKGEKLVRVYLDYPDLSLGAMQN